MFKGLEGIYCINVVEVAEGIVHTCTNFPGGFVGRAWENFLTRLGFACLCQYRAASTMANDGSVNRIV